MITMYIMQWELKTKPTIKEVISCLIAMVEEQIDFLFLIMDFV